MPAFLLNAPSAGQQRLYLDESGTLGYGGEIFTMAMVLVRDLPKLEACTLKNRTTQSEVKASQMKTAQKLALARTLLDENDIEIYLAKLDPLAAMISERKLDKELLYDSMVAQALAFYLERGDLVRRLPYRISMDMRGGLRESYEDMVAESVGNVLMHRADPLVSSLDARFLDSKYSAGVQAADLFSNIYRTALTQTDSPCRSFLHKYQTEGLVHTGFTFGLVELADQMSQIAADLRARVELERAKGIPADDGLAVAVVVKETLAVEDTSDEPTSSGISRSARRRRSRAARRDRENALERTMREEVSLEGVPAAGEDEVATEVRAADETEKATEAREADPHKTVCTARKGGRRETAAAPHEVAPVASEATPTDVKKIAQVNEPADSALESESVPVMASAQPVTPKPVATTRPVLPFAPEGRRTRRRPARASSTARETTASASSEPTSPVAALSAATETATPAKPDVRPGRAARSRQAAQVASRERRRTRATAEQAISTVDTQQATAPATELLAPQDKPAAKLPKDTPAQIAAPVQPAPLMAAPSDGNAATEVGPQPSRETDAGTAPEAPKAASRKRSNTRKRKTTPAASSDASSENPEAAQPVEIPTTAAMPSVAEATPEAPKPAPRKRSSSRRRKTAENPTTPATDSPAPNAALAAGTTAENSAS